MLKNYKIIKQKKKKKKIQIQQVHNKLTFMLSNCVYTWSLECDRQ